MFAKDRIRFYSFSLPSCVPPGEIVTSGNADGKSVRPGDRILNTRKKISISVVREQLNCINMGNRIDEVDEQILYYLAEEARHTSAPDIADEVDIAPPTARNRISRLEESSVIAGFITPT